MVYPILQSYVLKAKKIGTILVVKFLNEKQGKETREAHSHTHNAYDGQPKKRSK